MRLLAIFLASLPVALAGQGAQQGGAAAPPTPLAPDALFTVACATSTLEAGPIYALDDGALSAGAGASRDHPLEPVGECGVLNLAHRPATGIDGSFGNLTCPCRLPRLRVDEVVGHPVA